MRTYHKIQTMYNRLDSTGNGHGPVIPGAYATKELEYTADLLWDFTEKVDGVQTRVGFSLFDGVPEISFAGKTESAGISTSLFRHLQFLFLSETGEERLLRAFPHGGVILHGEGCGDKVKKGKAGRTYGPDADFVLFDVEVVTDSGWYWLSRDSVESVAEELGILSVPVIRYGTLSKAAEMVRDGFVSTWATQATGAFMAEGIVARPHLEMLDCRGNRIITKIKSRDFAKD